jgi:hypothetical protein
MFDIPSTLSCSNAIGHEVDCIRSLCYSLCVLVVDLPNGNDFPNQLVILPYNIFCRIDIPELLYATVSTYRCQIVVSSCRSAVNHIAWRLPCFIYTTPKTRRKRFSDWLFCEVNYISDWLIYISDNIFMLTHDATFNELLLHLPTRRTKIGSKCGDLVLIRLNQSTILQK